MIDPNSIFGKNCQILHKQLLGDNSPAKFSGQNRAEQELNAFFDEAANQTPIDYDDNDYSYDYDQDY